MKPFKLLNMSSTLGEFREKFNNDKDFRNYCWYVRASNPGVTDTVMAALLGGIDSKNKEYSVPNWAQNVKTFVLADKASENNASGDFNDALKKFGEVFNKNLLLENLWNTLANSEDLNLKDYLSVPQDKGQSQSGPQKGRTATAATDRESNFKTQLAALLKPSQKDDLIYKIVNGKCRQLIFTGAPGTGKTYIAKAIAEYMAEAGYTSRLPGEDLPYVQIQFHPSYDYTDFVEGLRPVEMPAAKKDSSSSESSMVFAKVDGHFKSFCRKVVMHGKPDKLYFFIIDEINRANLSKVFGELMYCLEKDKRGSKHGVKTQYQTLHTYDTETDSYLTKPKGNTPAKGEDCFFSSFYIPENVVVIGTMNDIDRSVESMDFALRRRFDWEEFDVTDDMLSYAFAVNPGVYGDLISSNPGIFVNQVNALNKKLLDASNFSFKLSRQYCISQGHFANLPENILAEAQEIVKQRAGAIKKKSDQEAANVILDYIWKYRLHSLLREYLRGEDEDSVNAFLKAAEGAFKIKVQDNRTKAAKAKKESTAAEA